MPIQVQGPDGSVVEFPDGTPNETMQSAMQQHFGGPSAPSSAPTKLARPKLSALRQSDAKQALDDAGADLERQIANLPEVFKNQARDKFFADPRIAALRVASAKSVSQNPKSSAETKSKQNVERSGNFFTGLKAGIIRGAFGLPERLAAAGEAYLPSAITGNTSDASYDEILNQVRQNTDADLEKSGIGNFLGQILSGGAIGGAALKGVGAAAEALPAGVGNVAQMAARIGSQSKIAKAAAITAGGAAGGGAQALGEGSDVGTGTAFGAVAAPLGMGAGKALGFVSRPFVDLVKSPSAEKILRRFTNATSEEMQAAADAYRRATGAEPTLYEILPQADRNNVAQNIVGRSPEIAENAARAVRGRVANAGPEMQNTIRNATGAQRARIVNQMAEDLNTARGTTDAAPLPGVERAAQSPADLKAFQQAEAGATMAPVADTQIADTVADLYPTAPRINPERPGVVEEVHTDPEVNDAIRNAASTLRLRLDPEDPTAAIAGITADDASRILRQLAKVPAGTPQKGAAMRAEQTIMDHLEQNHPEAGAAIAQMRENFASRARQVEGMAEGARGRTRESIPVETSTQARTVRNAFETPEGTSGRFLGQTNALGRDFGGTQSDVLRAAQNLAESGQTQAALRQNLGAEPARTITQAAEAQQRNLQKFSALTKENKAAEDTIDLVDIGKMALAMNPGSMPATKLFALSRLTTLTKLPKAKANQLVDMMFSQDPAVTNRAISLLNNAGRDGRKFLQDIGKSMVIGQLSSQVQTGGNGIPEAQAADTSDIDKLLREDTSDVQGMTEQGNIDLHNRPVVHNPDGTISTVRSITITDDNGAVLIPTVVDGKVVSNDEAIAHYKLTGEHLGKFDNEKDADAYAQSLHEEQADEYADQEDTGDNGDVPHGRAVVEALFPEAHITDDVRPANSKLGRENPGSYHVQTDEAVDVRPIPGMTFDEFVQTIEDNGYTVLEALNEDEAGGGKRSRHATGNHWHVVIS